MQHKQGCFAALISTLLIGCGSSTSPQPIANNSSSPAFVTVPSDALGTEHELVMLLKSNHVRVDKNATGDDLIFDTPQCRQLIVQYRRTMKQRLDIAARNIANLKTTHDAEGKPNPYRRRFVEITSNGSGAIQYDLGPFLLCFEPGNRDADENGYVHYPNVNTTVEFVNSIAASQCYELATLILCRFDPSYVEPNHERWVIPAER